MNDDPPDEPVDDPSAPEPSARDGSGEQPPPDDGAPRRLLRSGEDRMLAGIAGGLGRYFNVDPVIFRIGFGVSLFFGGLGVLAYLAMLIVVPVDDGSGRPAADSSPWLGVGRVVAAVVLIGAALAGLGTLVAGSAFLTGLGYGWAVAVAIVAIGLLVAAAAFRGGARWLIVPAVALAVGVGAAAAADLDLEGGIGEREFRPLSASAVPADGYRLGVGRLAVDLRGIDWSRQRVLDLDLRVGVGEAVVAVPSDVCVVADAHTGVGALSLAGSQTDGLGVDASTGAATSATPQLRLDADADVGALRVLNSDRAEIVSHRGPDGWDENDPAAQARNDRACAG